VYQLYDITITFCRKINFKDLSQKLNLSPKELQQHIQPLVYCQGSRLGIKRCSLNTKETATEHFEDIHQDDIIFVKQVMKSGNKNKIAFPPTIYRTSDFKVAWQSICTMIDSSIVRLMRARTSAQKSYVINEVFQSLSPKNANISKGVSVI